MLKKFFLSDTPKDQLIVKLHRLQSLIIQAQEIEQNLTAIVRSLQTRRFNPYAYQYDASLETNLAHVKEIFTGSNDIRFREFIITSINRKAAVVFIEGMASPDTINEHILAKLTLHPEKYIGHAPSHDHELDYVKNILLTAASITAMTSLGQAVQSILAGDTALFIDGMATGIVISTRKVEARAIAEPDTESAIRGPKDGFIEDLLTNITLLRRRIKDPNLVIATTTVGTRSHTNVAMVYYRGIANSALVIEVERRLAKLKIDIPMGAGIIQGIIEDHPYSPFPTMLTTERPDRLAAALMEGRVGILVDGSPFTLIAPSTFADFFHAPDDYYEKWLPASLIRLTRFLALLFSIATPAYYIAFTNFHPGFLPTPLAITIVSARFEAPMPAILEMLLMEIALELLHEAGVRLPKTVGPAVSIVGGLVIGESAVRAGLISPPIIIVIAFTAIAAFNVASNRIDLSLRLLRVPLMLLAAAFGMFGVTLGLIALFMHLSTLESFGEPYLEPLTPRKRLTDLKDSVVILSSFFTRQRPIWLEPENLERQEKVE